MGHSILTDNKMQAKYHLPQRRVCDKMMGKVEGILKAIIFATLSVLAFLPFSANAAAFPTAAQAEAANPARFGGQLIDNPTNYSSMPGYIPGSPYNYRRIPVVVQPPRNDMSSGECDMVLSGAIGAECAGGRCANMTILGIRPRLVLRLAQISGKDYSAACAGFIDSAWDRWKSENPDAAINYSGGAPAAKPAPTLGVASGGGAFPAVGGGFPTTINDVSYLDRLANTTAGLEPWADADPYKTITIENYGDYLERHLGYDQAEIKRMEEEDKRLKIIEDRLKIDNWCAWCNDNQGSCIDEIAKNAANNCTLLTTHQTQCQITYKETCTDADNRPIQDCRLATPALRTLYATKCVVVEPPVEQEQQRAQVHETAKKKLSSETWEKIIDEIKKGLGG